MTDKRKIALVGSANLIVDKPKLKKLKDYEFWAMNNLFTAIREVKFDRWFELHHFTRKGNKYYRRGREYYGSFATIQEYLEQINALEIPVYMQKPLKIVKQGTKFPFQEIMRKFKTQYFGCSFAWMIAFALYEHLNGQTVDTIALYGVALDQHEYYFQRPSTEYFIGRAEGMGIKVERSDTCSVLKAPWIYAYKENFTVIDHIFATTVRNLTTMAAIPMQDYFEGLYYTK